MSNLALAGNPQRVPALLMWVGGILFLWVLWDLLLHGQMDIIGTLVITLSLLLVAVRDKGAASILALSFLIVLGDVRRIRDVAFGLPRLDLFLLISPLVAACLGIPLILRARLRDPLSKAMLALLAMMVLEIVNPQQGGIAVGLAGALFYITPILWFWVARRYASPQVVRRLLFGALFPLAAASAVLGLVQTFIGFPPWEQAWIDVVGKYYHSLYVGKSVRAFGFSVSSAEYATLLGLAAAGTAATYFGRRRIWSVLLLLLIPALILASSRSLIFKLAVALGVVWTVRKGKALGGLALVRLGVAVAIGVVGVALLASHYAASQAENPANNSAAQDLLTHQEQGLAHPLDKRYSTAGMHGNMIAKGLMEGITDPIGHGLGSTSLGVKLASGPGGVGSSELDISDMFIDLGLVGGLIYLYVIVQVMRKALQQSNAANLETRLPVLAILTLSLGSWLIGGQYSTSSIVFFLIGSLSYEADQQTAPEAAFRYAGAGA